MALLHQVYDTDAHFKIDPVTRAIKNESTGKNVLIQYDHNSERFTFELPRLVDGHDMSKSTSVEIHYINIDSTDKTKSNADVYPVADLQISPDDENVVICSWLISQNATQYAGSLNFLLKFKCVDGNGDVVYRWNTAISSSISVSRGIDNGEAVVKEYPDVLAAWEARIDALEANAYHTTREYLVIGNTTNSVEYANAKYIWGLYDALQAEYGEDVVQKKEVTNNDGTFANYEYVISTGEYPTDGLYAKKYGSDPQIKKPKYLILSGIHGDERKTCLSTYRFIRDVLRGHNVPKSFREGVTLCVMPVGNPYGINAFTRYNKNGVDINRNFDWNWVEGNTYGTSAASEKETQAIVNWLNSHSDADLFLDFHNSGQINENVVVLGLQDVADTLKQIALRGIDHIIPFWRDVIGYPPVEVAYYDENNNVVIGKKPVIFSYSASIGESSFKNGLGNGLVSGYAQDALGINSIDIETSVYYGNYSDYANNKHLCPPETIAMGAEALGNILIEFYNQAFFGEVMTMDSKLSTLLAQVNSGFKAVSGTITLGSKWTPEEGVNGIGAYTFTEIPSGAKLVVIEADAAVVATAKTKTSGTYTLGAVFNFFNQIADSNINCYCTAWASSYSMISAGGRNVADTENGYVANIYALLAGKYNWTAYYWNE